METNAYGKQKKGGDSFRRKWDSTTYEQKARDREQQLKKEEEDEDRRRKGLKPRPAFTRESKEPLELLQARTATVNLEGMIGKSQVVQASSAASGQPGFYCKVCDVTVKDSLSYLDHINGKKHQRVLNRSMTVATETVEDVVAKLQSLRQARIRQMAPSNYDFRKQVSAQQQIDADKKQKRRETRRRHRQEKALAASTDANKSEEPKDEMAAMMGFGAFGTSKK
ncbi:U4/U6.U5 snRNP associated protein [Coemansia sp. RSA 1365]|nr:U4/U6.U5 snRNP associated protein [Coemansia sp. RSA 1365]